MEKMKIAGEIKHEKSGKRVIVTEEDVTISCVRHLKEALLIGVIQLESKKIKRVASWGHEQIARGGELKIHVCEPFDDEDTEWYTAEQRKVHEGT